MSFLHMRFGLPWDGELTAKVQECSNWGLAMVSGRTPTLLFLFPRTSEANRALIGSLGVQWKTAHLLFLFPQHRLLRRDKCMMCLHYFLLEKVSEADSQAVLAIGSGIHITKQTLALILSVSCSLVIKYCHAPCGWTSGYLCGSKATDIQHSTTFSAWPFTWWSVSVSSEFLLVSKRVFLGHSNSDMHINIS